MKMHINFEIDTENPKDVTAAIEILMRLEVSEGDAPDTKPAAQKQEVLLPNPLQFGIKEPIHPVPSDYDEVPPDYDGIRPGLTKTGATDVELDPVNGFPWDARIHAKNKAKNQDGSWKYLRGVDKNIIPQVEAELRAKYPQAAATKEQPPQVNAAELFQDTPQETASGVDFPSLIFKLQERKSINPAYESVYNNVLAHFNTTFEALVTADKATLEKINEAMDLQWRLMQG